MRLVSDDILIDTGAQNPVYDAIYPSLTDFALWNPSSWTVGHPFDLYKAMRETAPVMWSPSKQGMSGFWSISRYEDIRKIELATDVFSSQRGSINIGVPPRENWRPKKLMPAAYNSLINLDAQQHLEMRMQQKDFFLPPNYVAELRAKVEVKVDSLLDDMEKRGPVVDFVKLFAEQLPLFTLCEMLGIDEEDRPKVVHWMHYLEMASQFMTNPWQTFFSEPLFPLRFKTVVNDMFAYGESVMADRRLNPRDDLLTAIAQSTMDDELLPQEFLDGSWLLIIFAGNDTTRNSLSGTLRLMTQFPDQRAMLLEDPSLTPKMSDESLRMTTPVIHMRRTATQDTEIRGQKIAKDEKVVLWYGAGNYDADIFPNPDTFDMHRTNVAKHVAFGHGAHKCLGFRVAKMQLEIAFERIFDRFPNITWTGKQKISPNALVHAISSLEVDLYGKS
ncbi:cytochrome P450 [Halieaceae bacterium IMCC14734]|uniref:Cytochrome P450 n=1 Tax=Candidatus Litorirhabdus singularis TaxID=2518993 RepID=A0ABT3TNF1_9GAMM|nr:cytochrome P450 [Candidatus Litorirhabdus singularis]MCX2982904.1 cytochrome P450 [Candidatus Litorirhabdus singularis]